MKDNNKKLLLGILIGMALMALVSWQYRTTNYVNTSIDPQKVVLYEETLDGMKYVIAVSDHGVGICRK